MGQNQPNDFQSHKMTIQKPIESDESLMLKCRGGDLVAFDTLVSRYKEVLTNFIYQHIGDYEQTKDLVQETFFRVYKSKNRYRPTAKFSTWIYKIARNLYIDELKRRYRHPTISIQMPIFTEREKTYLLQDIISNNSLTPNNELMRKELQQKVRQIVNSLPAISREVVVMRLYQGLPFKTIALILNCSEGAAKQRMSHALTQLRRMFGNFL